MTLFTFDFGGCGMSEGDYISLGWWEREDLALGVRYLRDLPTVSCIGLWGRSMGAATALLHGDRDPSIAGMVLDSSFSSLRVLATELAAQYASKVPGFALSLALKMVRGTVSKKAQCWAPKLRTRRATVSDNTPPLPPRPLTV